MANPTWNTTNSDNWTTAADWSTGVVPQPADDVTIAQGDPQVTGNVGTVKSLTLSGTLDLQNAGKLTTTGTVTNTGMIYLDRNFGNGGASLSIGGTLTNSNYIDIGNDGLGSADTLTASSLNNTGGRIDLHGSSTTQATLNIGSVAGTGTVGHLTGTFNLYGDALVKFASGPITSNDASLLLNNSNSLIADANGSTTTNSALTGLTANTNYLELDNGASVTTSAGLTNTGMIYLDRNFGNGGASLSIGGTLTNSNYIDIGNDGLGTADTLTASSLNNTGGRIDLHGSSTTQATLNIGSVAGTGTAGHLKGTFNLYGDALVKFASGPITSNDASLLLNNSNSLIADANGSTTTNSALTGLTANTNYLELDNGASVTTSAGLTNTGMIYLDRNFGNGGASLSIGGTLTNSNYIDIGNDGLGTADTLTASSLNNTGGRIDLHGSSTTQATLNIGSVAGTGTAGHLTGTFNLYGDTLVKFASGPITSNDASLLLNNSNSLIADANGSTTTNSALTGLTANTNYLELDNSASVTTSAGLTNTGMIYLDRNFGNGGASLSIGGTLTNSNYIDIGDDGLGTADTLTATSLNNTGGRIDLHGSSTTQATLNIGSVAGTGTAGHLTGTFNLYGDTLVKFASGPITSNDASLLLNNSNSLIADANGSTTTNSALTGLTANTNYLELDNGASVTTSAGLTNTGMIYLDRNFGNGGASLSVGGTLTNSNYIDIGNDGLGTADTLTASSLNNTGGRIDLHGSSTTQATLNIGSVAGTGTAGHLTGTFNLYGDTLVKFASGPITSNDASLLLNNSNSLIADANGSTTTNSALTGLTANTNYLELDNGASVTTSAGLTNTGMIYLDRNFGNGGASLSVGGTLTNSNLVSIGNTGLGTADSVTATGLANTGTINIVGSSSATASLVVNGAAANNGGTIKVNAFGKVTDQGFVEGQTGSVSLEIQGQAAGQFATVATTGNVTLNGGTLLVPVNNTTLAAGQTYDLMTFTAGGLAGIFNTLTVNGVSGNGTSVNLGNGLTAGLVYGDAAGHLELQVVATPSTTTDTWTAGTGTWSTGASWTNGVPTFVSDVAIGSTSSANVTLTGDATINSLTLGTNDTLTTQTGVDLSIGSTVTVGTGATLAIGGGLYAGGTLTNNGTVNQTGTVTDPKIQNLTGATYNLAGDVGIGSLAITGSLFNNAGGTLAKTSGSGTSVVAASFTDGTSAASKIVVNSGTLQFMGATDNVVAQTISGAGTFGIGAGSATIGTGTAITTAGFAVSGSGTQVKLGENLTYGGSYGQSGSAGLNLAGFALALKGSASIVGAGGSGGYAGISGGGTATLSGTSTLGNLIVGGATALTNTSTGTMTTSGQVLLGGTSSLTNSGTINQGGTVTVGDASGSLAKLVNLTGGTYNLVGDVGIGIGANTGASFNNAGGTLAKTSGTGKSVVAVSVFDGNGAAGQIKIASGALQLNGPNNTLTAQTISGPGTLLFGTNTYNQIGAGTTITAGAVSMIGTGGTFKLGEDLGYGGNFSVLNNSVINLGSYGLTLSGTTSLVGAGTGNYASVSGSGTLTLSGTTTIGNFSILNSVQVVNTGTVTQTINVGIGDSGNQAAKVTNAAGATWTIASDGVLAGTTASSFVNAGTLVKTASTGYTQVTANFVTSAASPNAITINSGTMQFKGSTSAFVASTISGAGSFQILGGAATIGAGTSIATASFGLSGSGTSVTLGENLSYGNKFTDGGATLNLGSNTLSLSGSAGFTSASVTGTGVLSVSGSTTVSGLSVGGSATLQNSAGGVVTQSGTVTLGDSTNGAATLTDAGTWRISADVGIAAGGTASSLNVAGGTLTKTGGTGTSLIGVAVGNSGSAAGTIEASSGTLEFGGTVSGAENLLADANTTMIFDQSVGTGSAFVYHGANATLQLNDAQDFHGTIGSFAAGETLDLRSILFGSTSSSPSYSGTASGGTLTVSDGTHTASLAFLGNYTTANFHAASDNHGGTLFTFA